MFEAQRVKQVEAYKMQTASAQQSARTKLRNQRIGDPVLSPLYTQAWGNLPPPWLHLRSPQEASSEQPVQHQVGDDVQGELASRQMSEQLPVSVQKTSPVQRTNMVLPPFYTQAWGNQPPPWLHPHAPQQTPHKEEPIQRISEPMQHVEKNTDLPDTLKTSIEHLSSMSMDDVQVHYNSARPVQVQALAYTQDTDIFVGPGQEKHLAHEAWHVVQQKQGRVKPTLQAKGVAINDDQVLEREANVMGERASTVKPGTLQDASPDPTSRFNSYRDFRKFIMQRMVAVAKTSISGDVIEINSIKYGLDRAGGPVGLLKDLDFSKLVDGASLYIVAHGSKTESGDYTGQQIAAYLLNPKTGLRPDAENIKIVFTSCRAGEGVTDPATDSIVAILAQELKKAGRIKITIYGARGLSLKSSATGDDFAVIDPSKDGQYWPLQAKLLAAYDPKGKYNDWLDTNKKATPEEQANAASEIAREFYEELIRQAEELGLTFSNQEAMTTIKINDKGELFYKNRNMGESPFHFDIEDYGTPWKKL